jgi:hypothetical protein
MNPNDPYAKLGGGALDQELFKKKPTLLVSPVEKSQQNDPVKLVTPLSKPLKRKQISAYLTQEQLQKFKALHFILNSNLAPGEEIEKSDIVALGLDCLSQLLSIQVPKYSSIQELRAVISDQVSRYLGTQVPNS